jgi:hypothetical protein
VDLDPDPGGPKHVDPVNPDPALNIHEVFYDVRAVGASGTNLEYLYSTAESLR